MAGLDIEIGLDPRHLADLERAFAIAPKRARLALPRAINRAVEAARTVAKRAIAKELGISGSHLTTPHRFGARASQSKGKALEIKRATPENLDGRLLIRGKRIPLTFFKPRQSAMQKKRVPAMTKQGWRMVQIGRGVKWRIGGRAAGEKRAFVATLKSGHVGVFVRTPGTRQVFQLYGPSIPKAAEDSAELRAALNTDVSEVLARRVDYEVGLILGAP